MYPFNPSTLVDPRQREAGFQSGQDYQSILKAIGGLKPWQGGPQGQADPAQHMAFDKMNTLFPSHLVEPVPQVWHSDPTGQHPPTLGFETPEEQEQKRRRQLTGQPQY